MSIRPMAVIEIKSWNGTAPAVRGRGCPKSFVKGSMSLSRRPPRWVFASLFLLSLSVLPHAFSETQGKPDNSANNGAQNQSQTADQQNDNAADRVMAAKIRRAIVSDHSLSTYGHNVKVIVSGGTVTLKGPVHSEAEQQSIVAKAGAIAGQDKVTDQLTVKQ